ncbi:MAG: hypothetical protein ACTSV9_03725 [Candidatus Thorarchaeota archaeon]
MDDSVKSTASDYSEISNEKVIFVLNKFTGLAPYSHEFVSGEQDPQILAGFVSAMTSFMGELTGSDQARWKTEFGSGSTLLVEVGEWTTGVLAVSRETNEARSKLRRVVMEFEDSFKYLKHDDAIESRLFKDFDQFVRRTFLGNKLTGRSIILKSSNIYEASGQYESPSIAFKIAKLLHLTSSGQSLSEIVEAQGLTMRELEDLVSRALWKNAIYLSYVPSDDDILSTSEKSSGILLSRENPLRISLPTLRIVTALDGRSPLISIVEKLNLWTTNSVLYELGNLVNKGYLQRASIERRLLLLNECILSALVRACVRVRDSSDATNYFFTGQEEGIEMHPWVGRIQLQDNMAVRCQLDETMTPEDLDGLYDAVEFLILAVADRLSNDAGPLSAKYLLSGIRKRCRAIWSSYLMDVVV